MLLKAGHENWFLSLPFPRLMDDAAIEKDKHRESIKPLEFTFHRIEKPSVAMTPTVGMPPHYGQFCRNIMEERGFGFSVMNTRPVFPDPFPPLGSIASL